MAKTVVVTGASGFIGRSLLRVGAGEQWRDRYKFVALSSQPVGGLTWIDDRRNADGEYGVAANHFEAAGIDRVDHLIHLGAFIPKHGGEANAVGPTIANITNIPRLLDALPGPPRRIVFASSIDVYGDSGTLLLEDGPCWPDKLYGQSKLFGERVLEALVGTDAYTDTVLQVLRLGHVYGPGEGAFRKFIPETIRHLLGGQAPLFTATGQERRAFLYVDDCCEMILAALARPAGVGPINVAGTPCSLKDVAGHLARIHQEAGGTNLDFAWAENAKRGRDVVPDIHKMRRLLGEPTTSLQSGLKSEYEHFAGTDRADHI